MRKSFFIFLLSFATFLNAKKCELSKNTDSLIVHIVCSNIKYNEKYKAIENYKTNVLIDSTNIEITLMMIIVIVNDNDPRINCLAKDIITKNNHIDTSGEFEFLLKMLFINNKDTSNLNQKKIKSTCCKLGIDNNLLVEYLVNLNQNRYLLSRKIKRYFSLQYCS